MMSHAGADAIARITPSGTITEFPVPSMGSQPRGIAVGPDDNLWFTEAAASNLGRITTAGVVTEFSLPAAGSGPRYVTAGPDCSIWFTEFNGNQVGRLRHTFVMGRDAQAD
jgi:virginiamycin B lyase